MTMEWDYKNRTITLSMSEYVQEALLKFQHIYRETKCESPSSYRQPQYGIKMQLVPVDDSNPMTDKQIKLLQQVCGMFLYFVRAVDCKIFYALNNHYAANSDAKVTYQASDMILHNHSDATYLVASEAWSSAVG